MVVVSDYLVIGSGIAGLTFALKAAKTGTVHIITKKDSAESNTNYAQGGIAAVFSETDSFDAHIQDTLTAGDGLCNRASVDILVKEGPERIRELISTGVEFSSENGRPELIKEGGHSASRILHARDLTGREIERALLKAAQEHPSIRIHEHRHAIDLITNHQVRNGLTQDENRCYGAYVLNPATGLVDVYQAKVTFLSTGGAGRVYLHTTNPSIATGDGIAMAWRAGTPVANLEFMQFHPTSFQLRSGNHFLISEAVRGHGGILRTRRGERFMEKYDPRLELATRDIVARAIDQEMKKTGDESVFLDVTHLESEEIDRYFPTIAATCLREGIDIRKDWIPVVPAAHYMCGGVVCDSAGRSSIRNLFVGGETAFTGVHGANRLASNSLLEAVVWAHRSVQEAEALVTNAPFFTGTIPPWDDKNTRTNEEWVLISHNMKEIRTLMWDYVGIVRSNDRLSRARRRLQFLKEEIDHFYKTTRLTPEIIELRNLATVATLIVDCALTRKESRGLHYSLSWPTRSDTVADTILTPPKA